MALLIIPGVCLYFFIGSALSKVAESSGDDGDLDDVVWYMFWPVIVLMFVAIGIIYIIGSITTWVSELFEKHSKHNKKERLNK